MKNLVKIKGYKGIYLVDKKGVFKGSNELNTSEIQRKITPPYELAVRYYENKNSVYKTHIVPNNTSTLRANCEKLVAHRTEMKFDKKYKITEPKLDAVFEAWLQTRKNVISQNHFKTLILNYNAHIKGAIGAKKIKELCLKDMQSIVNSILERGKAPRTAKTIKDILSPIFEFGVKNGYVKRNLAREIQIPKFDNKRYFEISDEDLARLYEAIFNYENLVVRAIFVFLLHGRRKSEVTGLKWENIDLQNKIYTLPYDKNKSRRNLQFPLKEAQIQALQAIGIKSEGFVFTQENGKPYGDIRWHWEKIKSVLSKPMRIHDFRHLLGFLGVNKGLALEAIGKTLGHSSYQVTQRYANVTQDTVSKALDEILDFKKI